VVLLPRKSCIASTLCSCTIPSLSAVNCSIDCLTPSLQGDDGVQVFGQPPRAIPLPDDDPGVDFSTVQVQDPPSALSASSPDKKAQSGGTQPGGSRPVPDPPQLVERAEVELPRRVVRIMPGQFLSDDPCEYISWFSPSHLFQMENRVQWLNSIDLCTYIPCTYLYNRGMRKNN